MGRRVVTFLDSFRIKPTNRFNILKKLPALGLLLATGLLSGPALAQTAYIDGDKLILPVVHALGLDLYVEVTIVPFTDPPVVEVTDLQLLNNPDTTNASFYENGVLTIVDLGFGGHARSSARSPGVRR